MINEVVHGHTMKKYDAELRKLEKRVLGMGELVREQLEGISQAIRNDGDEPAMEVIENEKALDTMELKADKLIIKVIARRAPMGHDLRFLVAVSRMVADLESLGDEAGHMARSLIEGHGNRGDKIRLAAYEELDALTLRAAGLLREAMKAFDELDLKAARELAFGSLGQHGELRARLGRLMLAALEQEDVGQSVDLALAVRSLERICNCVRKMAEHVIYLVSSEDVRHQDDD